jgi:hypothetical protein
MSALEEQGTFKSISSAIRLGGDIVDMIPLGFVEELGAAGLAALAGGVDVVGKLIKLDFKGAGEEVACGIADTAVAALPFAEYARVISTAGKAAGLDVAEYANLRALARKGASSLYNSALGGRTSSVFKEAAVGEASEENAAPSSYKIDDYKQGDHAPALEPAA